MTKENEKLAEDMAREMSKSFAMWLLHPSKKAKEYEAISVTNNGEVKAFYAGLSAAFLIGKYDYEIISKALEMSITEVKKEVLAKAKNENEL